MNYHRGLLLGLLLMTACASRHSEWDDIDYTRVKAHYGENDANYTMPAGGCVDDDLQSCR